MVQHDGEQNQQLRTWNEFGEFKTERLRRNTFKISSYKTIKYGYGSLLLGLRCLNKSCILCCLHSVISFFSEQG